MANAEPTQELLAAKDWPAEISRVLGENLSPFHAEAYETARSLFPCPELDRVNVRLSYDLASFHGGPIELSDGRMVPSLAIGMQKKPASRNIYKRLISRFGMPPEAFDDVFGHQMMTLVILPHELGHIIQMNAGWQESFGGLKDGFLLPDSANYTNEEYRQYLASDAEGNADYIAACIVGATSYGATIGVKEPTQDAAHWRDWVAEHPVILD